jgi:hypothetical protein
VFPSGSTTGEIFAIRRYQIRLPFGLFNQGKLIATKFMASQLAIELTLGPFVESMMIHRQTCIQPLVTDPLTIPVPMTGSGVYTLSNVQLLSEILEFDATYDAMFLDGLQSGGIPYQFAEWKHYSFQQSTIANIQERSRSLKCIFAMFRLAAKSYENDSGVTVANVGGARWFQSYQYRIGNRYFPASPVIVGSQDLSNRDEGGCEAYVELEKCLNIVGDTKLSTNVNSANWHQRYFNTTGITLPSGTTTAMLPRNAQESDGLFYTDFNRNNNGGGSPKHVPNGACATIMGGHFVMAMNVETTNGRELSGLNVEEQSDIQLVIQTAGGAFAFEPLTLEVYTYSDVIMILRENNVAEILK